MKQVDEDRVEFERLQGIARAKRAEWEAAATVEQRRTLLNEVLSTTVALVNHEADIPVHRELALAEQTARRWQRLAGPGLGVLAVTAVVTFLMFDVWGAWAGLPVVAFLGAMLVFVNTTQVAQRVDAAGARLVTAAVVVTVVAGTLTTLLAPLLPGAVLIVGALLVAVSVVGLVLAWSGSPAGTAVFGGRQ